VQNDTFGGSKTWNPLFGRNRPNGLNKRTSHGNISRACSAAGYRSLTGQDRAIELMYVSAARHTYRRLKSITHCLTTSMYFDRYSVSSAIKDDRLSWPGWLVTYRSGLPARRRSSIPVLTGLNVE